MPRSTDQNPKRKKPSAPKRMPGEGTGLSTERDGHWRSYGIGIDTHSQFVTVTVLIPDYAAGKERLHRKNFPTDLLSLRSAQEWVRGLILHLQPASDPLHYTLESSATYHLPLVHCWGGKPSIINPAHAKLDTRKTDDIDSGSLAEQDLKGKWRTSFVHSPELTAARILLKERARWSRLASTLRKSILSGLNRFGHAFQTLRPDHIDPYPLIEDFLRNGKVSLAEAVKCVGPLAVPRELADYWIEQLVNSATYLLRAKQHHKTATEILRKQTFTTLHGQIGGKELLKLLETVPGVGPVTATTFVAEVGSIERFDTARGCAAWAGFDPSLKISGGKVVAHVTRGGHRHLHWLICEAAGAVLRSKDCSLMRWGQAIAHKHKKGGYQKATGAVGRRIVEGLYHVWCRAEEWKPSKQLESDHAAEEACPADQQDERTDANHERQARPARGSGPAGKRTAAGAAKSPAGERAPAG
jgi:transposase